MEAFWKKLAHGKTALRLAAVLMAVSFLAAASSQFANAQDQDQGYDQDDPPGRVARLGYMQGSVSFQPAGENEWVEAVANRPMTTGDKLWADKDSRAEIQLGSAMINLAPNTGFSFLNLDDRTVQVEVTAGAINLRVWSMDRDSVFEIDTPNQAFTIEQPGRYKIESSENGDYSVVTIWQGAGESTGNGQSYTLHAGQRTTFSGTNALNAEVQQIGDPDDFDNWTLSRERRYDSSPSSRYCSREVVGFDDLDDNGDWQAQSEYGNVWYPRVNAGWAPYRDGHWAWVDPWGWTWVDDARWGYAPFHYGRWAFISNRWGWIPGPISVRPVYAPALVVFVGGGPSFGGNVAWFPLGPREVYVPSYAVSRGYVNRVNVSNTVVNQTTITNVYNTTIINKSTTINNVTYVNRTVNNAVTAVPQRTFVSAQPVARAAVQINQQQIASASMNSRAAVTPAREAVLGAHANTANRVAAPPQAIANRTITAKAAPPPPPPSFAARQQMLNQHPGQAIARQDLQKLAPASNPTARVVTVAPPAKPATATPAPANQPNRPGNPPATNERPGATAPPAGQPNNRPQPGQPTPNQPAPNNRPAPNSQPNQPAPNRPENQPTPNRPDTNRPPTQPAPNAEPNRPAQPPMGNDRPSSVRPDNRPQPNQPAPANRPDTIRPDTNRPQPNRPEANQPTPNNQPAPNNRPAPNAEPNRQPDPPARAERPSSTPPNARPSPQPAPTRPDTNRPDANRPDNDRPQAARPSEEPRSEPTARPEAAPRPEPQRPPAEARPTPQQQQQRQQEKPKKPEDHKDDDKKPQ